ncbi:BTB domain-containing protein [Caenorhabditis elegans]|uniref:BTB domain-containing protein n=1 Tax=Caenorhabditis elegans TaxID=6239 RepID=O76610_CAEEL|nr:BTB domain-containing protein [Caenorhabditis elegans]CCD63704.1 BTB domain-containing protein [Caenorhabditis elegans]|eukprot:NP_494004.2 BTB and MATH domain containing [Caenorhabditis elegans]
MGPPPKLRNFDHQMEPYSDVVLVASQEWFHVSKAILCDHSPYFRCLLSNFPRIDEKPVHLLKGVNPADFQKFLEVLHGEPAIFECTIYQILLLAVKFQTYTVIKKCEKFLIHTSMAKLETKLALAQKYDLTELQTHCNEEFQAAFPVREPEIQRKPAIYRNKFTFKYTFEKFDEDCVGGYNVQLGFLWSLNIHRKNDHLRISLCCDKPEPTPYWEVRADFQLVLPGQDEAPVTKGYFRNIDEELKCEELGREIEWEEIADKYPVDGYLTIEARVNVIWIKEVEKKPEIKVEKKSKLITAMKKLLTVGK